MKLRARNGLLLLLAAAVVVVSAGCPNSQSITAGVGTAQLAIVMTNQPARFDVSTFDITRILVRPADPNANQALGASRDIALSRSQIFVDATLPMVDTGFLPPVPLSKGVYEIVEIEFANIIIVDRTNPFIPPDPTTCEGSQQFYGPPVRVTASSFAVPLEFTIFDSQDTVVTFSFDMGAMITALNNAYTCSPGCFGFCITNFDPAQFAADITDYLTII